MWAACSSDRTMDMIWVWTLTYGGAKLASLTDIAPWRPAALQENSTRIRRPHPSRKENYRE